MDTIAPSDVEPWLTERDLMNSIPALLLAMAALIVIGFHAVSFVSILTG